MSIVHKFRIGMITEQQMLHSIARDRVQLRPELDPENKYIMHELALAMGSDDPTKADYTKFLRRRRSGQRTNVVPLLHDCYKNLVDHNEEVITRYC